MADGETMKTAEFLLTIGQRTVFDDGSVYWDPKRYASYGGRVTPADDTEKYRAELHLQLDNCIDRCIQDLEKIDGK